MIDAILIIFLLFVGICIYELGYTDCYIDFLKGKFNDEEPLIKLGDDDK